MRTAGTHDAASFATSLVARTAQWISLLGAPALWFIEFNVSYWLVPVACSQGHALLVTLICVLFLALTLAIAWLAWWNWQRVGRAWPSGEDEDTPVQRSRFMSVLGLMSAGLFGLLVLSDLIPTLIIHPCAQ